METETNRGRYFVTSRLPWVVAGGMLVIYLITINRWLTPASLMNVAKLNGWDWRPAFFRPALLLVTYPFGWLPSGMIPLALNLFSAVCGALSLGLLARSVALLPHDRTHEQRQREQSEFAFLTIRSAWIPPVMAALVCGLQMTFWENAIDATGEMFDLLLFAYVIRCLLEYRISREDSWLTRFALVYGIGMAENWALIGFFPACLAALVWIKGLSFFNGRFLIRTALFGLLGFSLILLLPVVNSIFYRGETTFLKSLEFLFTSNKVALFHAFPRSLLVLLSLTSLLPIFLMSIRWASYFGDTSPLGIFIATFSFHIVHFLFLVACIWMAMDSPLSPRMQDSRVSFLTLYYLGALSVGYFMGYFLLIFSPKIAKSRQRINPLVQWIHRSVTAFIWVLFVAVPLVLVAKNLPQLERTKSVSASFEKYSAEVQASLPDHPAIILSDDSFRLLYVQAGLHRAGYDHGNLYIDTFSFSFDPLYSRYLAKKYPQYDLTKIATNNPALLPGYYNVVLCLNSLQQTHELYYLQPSFGFFSEEFSRQPLGVIYQLTHYPSDQWNMPLPTEEQIQKNQAFWKQAANEVFPALTNAIATPRKSADPNLWQRFLASAHLTNRKEAYAFTAAAYYSRAINYWGVELQKCGKLEEARTCFEQALQLNPANISAKVNQEFNLELRGGHKLALHMVKDVEDQFGQHSSWDQILNTDGPFDDPSFRLHLGTTLTRQGNVRQAAQEISRVSELMPTNAVPVVRLAQLFVYIPNSGHHVAPSFPINQCYSNAVTTTDRALELEPDNTYALAIKSMALMEMEDFKASVPVLDQWLHVQTNNPYALLRRAIANLQLNQLDSAQLDYQKIAELYTNTYQAYYGLGEIAYRRKDTPGAVKNYSLYLSYAPTNTPEFTNVQARLNELKSGAH